MFFFYENAKINEDYFRKRVHTFLHTYDYVHAHLCTYKVYKHVHTEKNFFKDRVLFCPLGGEEVTNIEMQRNGNVPGYTVCDRIERVL